MDKLIENVKSIQNRCEIIHILYEVPGKLHLVPTVIEDMYDVVHKLIEDYCIEKDNTPI